MPTNIKGEKPGRQSLSPIPKPIFFILASNESFGVASGLSAPQHLQIPHTNCPWATSANLPDSFIHSRLLLEREVRKEAKRNSHRP
jgi:hypothetical protein